MTMPLPGPTSRRAIQPALPNPPKITSGEVVVQKDCDDEAECTNTTAFCSLLGVAEGAYILQRLWWTGGPLDALRNCKVVVQ